MLRGVFADIFEGSCGTWAVLCSRIFTLHSATKNICAATPPQRVILKNISQSCQSCDFEKKTIRIFYDWNMLLKGLRANLTTCHDAWLLGGAGQNRWKEQIWLIFPLSGWVLPSWGNAARSWTFPQLISFQKFAAVGEKSVPPWADSALNPSRFSVPKGDLTRNPYIRLKNNQKEIPYFLF